MKHIRHILICLPIILAGCVVTTDHHYPKIPSEPTESTNTGDIMNPLTPAELEHVKAEIDHLQPYMTPNDCTAALGIPRRAVITDVDGPAEHQSIYMQLREKHVLVLIRDGRGYVISAKLDEKQWQWPKNHKTP
jgi:hypothetical protein